jgi:hypothetical protein
MQLLWGKMESRKKQKKAERIMEECIECMVLLCCFVAFLANLEAMSLFKNLSC